MGRIQRKEALKNKKKSNKFKSAEKTRKQLRKEKRQQKKISRAIYYQKNKSRNQSEKVIEKPTHSLKKIDDIITSREEEENIERKKIHVTIFEILININHLFAHNN